MQQIAVCCMQAEVKQEDGSVHKVDNLRHFCKVCGSHLWAWAPCYAEVREIAAVLMGCSYISSMMSLCSNCLCSTQAVLRDGSMFWLSSQVSGGWLYALAVLAVHVPNGFSN